MDTFRLLHFYVTGISKNKSIMAMPKDLQKKEERRRYGEMVVKDCTMYNNIGGINVKRNV